MKLFTNSWSTNCIVCLIIVLLSLVFTNGEVYCIGGCNGHNVQYEEICCDPDNLGDVVRIVDSDNDYQSRQQQYVYCPSTLPTGCGPYTSCSDILSSNPTAVSGYYNITTSNGSVISVYCDMEGDNCDGEGGWTRIAYFNTAAEPNTTCPTGYQLQYHDNIGYSLCDVVMSYDYNYCSSVYSTHGYNYTKVCGQAKAYQHDHAFFHFNDDGIDDYFGSGISITYGNPRQHIWTYAPSDSENETDPSDCPCNSGNTHIPKYFGNDYYCESANNDYSDPLWDGKQCYGLESPCCTNPRMPWFTRTLNETNEDIEVRFCGYREWYFFDYGSGSLGLRFEVFELYVK